MKFKMIFIIVLLVSAEYVFSSGYGIFEQGAKASGMAGAFTATADDPSAIFYNVAGLAFLTKEQLYAGGNLIFTSGSFTGADPFPGASVKEKLDSKTFFIPNIYYLKPLNNKITFGVGIFSAFGLETEWKEREKFSGRFISQHSQLNTLSINPSIAYSVNDNLGLGLGIELKESSVILERNIPFYIPELGGIFDVAHLKIKSDRAWDFSFNLGFIYKFNNNYRFGISYRHKLTADYSGKGKFNIIPLTSPELNDIIKKMFPEEEVSVKTNLSFPSILSLGFAYQFDEDLYGELDVNWVSWNVMQNIIIDFIDWNIFDTTIKENYKNSFNIRIGLEKIIESNLKLRTGIYYDKTPVPVESIDPILPDSSRIGLSFGMGMQKGNVNLEIYDLIIFFMKADTKGQSHFGYNGTYKNFANVIGFALTWGRY